jgi:transketolase
VRNTFIATLKEIAAEDRNIWLLCGDLGFSVLESFQKCFPDRYINVGVAEQNMAGIAAGLALSGKTVFIYSIGNFPTLRCLEQLRNDVCYHKADVKVISVGGGFAYGSQGYTHHAIEDVAVMGTLPGMEIFVPCDPIEVRLATQTIAKSSKPSYLRLSRTGEPNLHKSPPQSLYRPTFLRLGRDVTILACGPIASACIAAAEILMPELGPIAVASVPCVKPFDAEFLDELSAHARLIVTVEEQIAQGGLYAAVVSSTALRERSVVVCGLAIPEPAGKISTAGDREALLASIGLGVDGIARRIRDAASQMQVSALQG